MIRKMTAAEIEEATRYRELAGAVGRNAVVCECGHIEHTPNNEIFQNCVICVARSQHGKHPLREMVQPYIDYIRRALGGE